ncbi:phosphoglycerate kinase [Candidatus Pelagibacter sp.]|uniref:phosphoglycerate kinase n=1 Tax=Candidatus Pelagibacter sp. TaxID=2024849 RepID=UPI003F84A8ED
MKKIEDLKDLDQKKVLVRFDLNVPLKDGRITDPTRIIKIIPTLKFLIKCNAKIIIISHVGRPKGKINKDLSMQPICEYLSTKLGKKVELLKKNIFDIDSDTIFKNNDDDKLFVFENIRFYEQEEKNDSEFARVLSTFGDIYVNDAFSCSHRAHTSVDKITKFLPSYCGIQMNTELTALKKVTSNIERPITCIIGGSKISTKINVIKNLITKFENIVIVGGMANNLLEYQGFKIGKSIKEEGVKDTIDKIYSLAKENNCKILLPTDVSVGKNLNDKNKIKHLSEIENDELILDIGPETISSICSLLKKSKTVLWNGPLGYFENPNFAIGSIEIAKKIVALDEKIYSVAGGGDTIAVLNEANAFDNLNFVSTAGGAFLEYLEGKELPGIRALN